MCYFQFVCWDILLVSHFVAFLKYKHKKKLIVCICDIPFVTYISSNNSNGTLTQNCINVMLKKNIENLYGLFTGGLGIS